MVTNAMQQLNGKHELFSGYLPWFTKVKPVTCRVRQATIFWPPGRCSISWWYPPFPRGFTHNDNMYDDE